MGGKNMSIARNIALAIVLALAAPAGAGDEPTVRLTGAGATFPMPLYQTVIALFMQSRPNVKINYSGGGSGQGIKGIIDKTLDFAGSDAPMSKQELAGAGGADAIVQIPSCAGGVVPAYNVPGASGDIKFTGDILADIYLGKISSWNDPRLIAINPDLTLPNLPVTCAWRSDGSGTNFVWTSYLSTQSDNFKSTIGVGKTVSWPLGLGGNQNAGVAAIITQTPGAIGYVEQNFADKNNIRYGLVRNKAGKFIKASVQTVANAGAGAAAKLSGHLLKASIWNQDADDVYPISSFTYLIAYKDLRSVKSRDEAQTVVDFFWYATHDGQSAAAGLFYAPLAPEVAKKVEDALASFTYQGEPIKPHS
jgi:phosphate transport system substrate-binding protein